MSALERNECCYAGRRHAQSTGETPSSHPGPCNFSPLNEAVEGMVMVKRLLDALHAHHNNDESPANCAACRKVLAP